MSRFLKTPEVLIFFVSLWLALVCNLSYWQVIAGSHPDGALPTFVYFVSFFSLTIGLISLVMLAFAAGRITRVVLGLALVVAASAGYFTSKYGVLIDAGMITNIVQTNKAEAFELVSPGLLAFIALAGVLPALAVWYYPLQARRWRAAFLQRGVAFLLVAGLILVPLTAYQKEIVSVVRNHKELRHMIAPLNAMSAGVVTIRDALETPPDYQPIALDALHASATASGRKPTVHVLIVGETARAANFSLDGYRLDTNPELEHTGDIRFFEAASCGTATAVSLPCMFSIHGRDDFDRERSKYEDNLLDVVARSGYDVLWIDNGNGCKGVCARVANRDVHVSHVQAICPDDTCYDEILVEELKNMLPTITNDTLIVLHQLGSHGPAYYRRYPESYRVFQPDCRSANFGDCSPQEISNSYDNTIAYTDHVIAAAIDALSEQGDRFDASLIYVSDHGESLGEHNLYLHGMPYRLAPAEQTTVPLIVWLGQDHNIDRPTTIACDSSAAEAPVSHDNLFHTELGLLGVSTEVYEPAMDLFSACRAGTRVASST